MRKRFYAPPQLHRTRPDQGLDAVDTVAREMSTLLGWNAAETQRQKEDYRAAAASG